MEIPIRTLAGCCAKNVVGMVVVGTYRGERRRIKVDEIRDLRDGITVILGFDMDRGVECAAILGEFEKWSSRSYQSEAKKTRSTAAIVIDDGKVRRVVRCCESQDGFVSAKRRCSPDEVIYPISAAI